MKKYDLLLSFGCSYTEGGGLNSQDYHRYLKGEPLQGVNELLPEHQEYATQTSYPAQLAKLLNCDSINYGESRGSNEFIFRKLHDEIQRRRKELYTKNILVTVQTSHLNRILVQLPYGDYKELNVNNSDITLRGNVDTYPPGIAEDIKTYYELYGTRFFNELYEYQQLLRNINVYSSWLDLAMGVDVVFIMYEHGKHGKNTHEQFKCILDLDGKDLMHFTGDNKLRISDMTDNYYNDCHLSPQGHEVLAKRIYDHLNKK
jgi:hypothetical protein